MGCTHWTKQHEVDGTIDKPNQNGFKSVSHATTEFDLSGLESEDEDINFSFNAIKKNHRQHLTNKFGPPLHGLNSANNTSLAIVNSVLDNRIVQTGV